MTMRARALHLLVAVALIGGMLAVIPLSWSSVGASPAGSSRTTTARFQETTSGYPVSLTVEGQQFVYDRLVPLDRAELERIDDQDRLAVYARSDTGPFDVVYGLLSGRSRDGLARYLPTNAESPDTPCAAEAVAIGPLSGGDANFAFANVETDITTDDLEQIADAGGQPVYAEADAGNPPAELFLETEDGLLRFVVIENGQPGNVEDQFAFAGQLYSFDSDITDAVDQAGLTKVGCVGSFPAFAEAAEAPFDQLILGVADRFLAYTATGAAPEPTEDGDGTDDEQPIEDTTPDDEATPDEATNEQAETPDDASTDDDQTDDVVDDQGTPDDLSVDDVATEGQGDDEASPGPDDENGQGNGLPVELGENLGAGGQPDGLPREIIVGGARFLFDRIVPLSRQELTRVAQEQELIVYARSDAGPFAEIYVSVPNRSEDELARYLPENLDDPAAQCRAEVAEIGTLDAGGTTYAFAGYETDLAPEDLEQVAESGGSLVYSDPGAGQPFPELFIDDNGQLLRFVVLDADGRPSAVAESLAFNGLQLAFVADVSAEVDLGGLVKVGCAGPFPAYAATDAEEDLGTLYLDVGDRVLQYGEGEAPVEASPTEVVDVEGTAAAETALADQEAQTATVVAQETEAAVAQETEAAAAQETEAAAAQETEAAVAQETEAAVAVENDAATQTAVAAETEAAAQEAEATNAAATAEAQTAEAEAAQATADADAAQATVDAEAASTLR